MYLIMERVKQGCIKYQFWVFGMTPYGIETQISRAIEEHCILHAIGPVKPLPYDG